MNKLVQTIKSKESRNALWLIGGKVAQMVLSLIVGILTARYLGPGNYGLTNYGAAYVGFFSSLCTLGINSVIVKDFVDNPDDQGKAIGTTLVLRFISSVISIIMITSVVCVIDAGEKDTIIVVILCSLSLVFHIFDTFTYWFQYIYKAKATAVALFSAYFATSVYKIVLLVLDKDVAWFAFATSVDYIVLAIILFFTYKRMNGPVLTFSFAKAKSLLGSSYHYILSGMMVAIYGQTDKLMIKQMMTETDVGYYATAVAICNMWVFVLMAIKDAMYPTILRLYKIDREAFNKKNRQLYCIIFYISVIVSLIFTVFGGLIVRILYGEEFLPATMPLKIITWYTAFSYLGVARNAWIVCENKQKYLKYMYVGAAMLNVGINAILIPIWGVSGAAFASLITQIFTSIILPAMIPDMRENTKLMLQAIAFIKLK